MKDQKGFTIVELLIVIVVIGILAAIVIVAYQGVTARANTTKAKTNASTVQKKAEAFNADDSTGAGNGTFPTSAAAWTTYSSSNSSATGALPAGVSATNAAPSNTDGTTRVQYLGCTNASGVGVGYQVKYYDYTSNGTASTVLSGGTTSGAGITCA